VTLVAPVAPKRSGKYDVRLDDDHWFPWLDIAGREATAMDIDQQLTPALRDLFACLESFCVSGCCGIDAYDLSVKNDTYAISLTVASDLTSLRQYVSTCSQDVFRSHYLNNYFHREVLLAVIDHLIQRVECHLTKR
jgi:hypothetical protein